MSNLLVINFVEVQLLLLYLERYVWNIALLNSLILQSRKIWFVFLSRSFQVTNAVDVIESVP